MIKRTIVILLLFCFLVLALLSLESSDRSRSEIITLSNSQVEVEMPEVASSSNVSVYKTENVEEYLSFLESFDESNNEILEISTCMYTGSYTSGEFYMVTYKKLNEPREVVKSTGKVSLFKTKSEEQYCSFLANFDESNNEILGISTSMYTGSYTNGEFYMVTFRELK